MKLEYCSSAQKCRFSENAILIVSGEENIEKFELEISKMDKKLANPDQYAKEIASGELYKAYEALKKELEAEMGKWEELQLEYEGLKSNSI